MVFILLSALFGLLTLALTPPLRGPDESPHFPLRAYGLLAGDIVPRRHAAASSFPRATDMELYEPHSVRSPGRGGQLQWQSYARLRAEAAATASVTPAVFAPYAGSEG